MITLTPEQKALLTWLRVSLGHAHPRTLDTAAASRPDWDAVLAMARYHGIAPLLHGCLQRHPGLPIPQHVSSLLAEDFISNSALLMLHEGELDRVAVLFHGRGLPFAFLKGLPLAFLVYPQPEWRPCGCDIDILVKNGDYPRVKTALAEIGYRLDDPGSEAHELAFIGEAEFSRRIGDRKVVLDVHTDFNANSWGKVSGFDMEGFWGCLSQVERGGLPLPLLPVDAHLIFLAIHAAANHVFDRLIIFCDLDLLIRKYRSEIDWKHIAEYACSRGGRKAIYHSLNFCSMLLGTPIPGPFLRTLRPGTMSRRLVPAHSLLIRTEAPTKAMHRYMHLVLLDNPGLMLESLRFFLRRIISARSARGNPIKKSDEG